MVPLAAVVNRVATMSALLAACGLGLFLLLGLRLGLSRTVAGAAALLLGFSFPVWAVAVDVEVYSLTFALVLLLWLAVESAERGGQFLIPAYVAGLTLTNHMSAASAVLGAVVTMVLACRREFGRRLPLLVLSFALGISPYLFLVLRARAGPLLAWGDPVSLERLYWHVTGKQYQVWMFSQSFSEVVRNAGKGAVLLAGSFLYVLVPLVLYGAVRLFRLRRSLALGMVVSALASFAYAVNYSIPDIESYYLPCLVALAVFGAAGLDGLARRMGKWRHAVWAVPAVALIVNFQVAGRQKDCAARDHAMNTLASAEANAIIVTDWWDVYSPVFYLQNVEGVRPDVCMVDKELLRRSWYFAYLARAYPWLVERSKPEIDAYRECLDQFEHDRLRDPAEIQRRYIAMLESFLLANPGRPAYTTFGADANQDAREMLPQQLRAPVGLLFRLQPDSTLPAFDYQRLRTSLPAHAIDMRTRATLERYRFFVVRRLQWLAPRGGAACDSLVQWYRGQPVAALAPLSLR
jgi:hypothetical protein